MYHALGLFAVVWFRTLGPDQVSETVAGLAFIVGVVVFGGSLVTLSLTGERRWGAVAPIPGFAWSVVLTFGTVLDEGENPGAARVLAAAGHGAAVAFHYAVENRLLGLVPGGEEWAAAYASVPERVRHLALHDRHLIAVNERDRPFVTGALLAQQGLALPSAGWRERVELLESEGATEVAYQPAGPDIARELEAFASAVRG